MDVDSRIELSFHGLGPTDPEFGARCFELSADIVTGGLSILDLVQQLGGLLANTHVAQRELGTWILSTVLESVPSESLSEAQLRHLCDYYRDKFKDTHQLIPPVLRGVLALVRFTHLPEGATAQILNALVLHVPCQQQQQADRHNIYRIFEAVLDLRRSEVLAMDLDYVYGVIAAVDGERDPKNLIFLFTWYPKFLSTVKLKHLSEEMFEVMACYFPVDFKAPPQDPNAITRDILAEALSKCLCAISEFAQFCIPLALEKLDSSLKIAKLDSLKLLTSGCASFDFSVYIQHAAEMWSAIQKEMFNKPTQEIEEACLSALSSVVKKISEDSASAESILKSVCDTLKGNLVPDSKLFAPSVTLLLHVAAASQLPAKFVAEEVLPILTNLYSITKTEQNKGEILKTAVSFAVVYAKLFDSIEFAALVEVPHQCLAALSCQSELLKTRGLEGLTLLCKYLPLDVRLQVYSSLVQLLTTDQSEDMQEAVLSCFRSFAQHFGSELKEHVIDLRSTQPQNCRFYFEALSAIGGLDFFTDYVISCFLSKIIIEGSDLAALPVFRKFLETHESSKRIQQIVLEKGAAAELISWQMRFKGRAIEERRLTELSAIIKMAVGSQHGGAQEAILKQVLPDIRQAFRDGGQNGCVAVYLLDGVLCRTRRHVQVGNDLLLDLTGFVVADGGTDEDAAAKNVAVALLANLLNKCEDDDVVNTYLDRFQAEPVNVNVTLLSWVTKALVIQNHPRSTEFTNRLIRALDVTPEAARGFRIVMDDGYDSLSAKSYCRRMVLYQQKFFNYVSTHLSDNYEDGRASYLEALGYLLEFAPKPAVLMQFKKLLRLIILCLEECRQPKVLCVLIETINDFVRSNEECIEDNLQEFISRTLALCGFEKSMEVRVAALRLIYTFATSTYPQYKLILSKQSVLSALGKCVDDKKRMVRKAAVEARAAWYLFDAPL